MIRKIIKFGFIASLLLIIGCAGNDSKELKKKENIVSKVKITNSNNWNISFLLDLSDRIDPELHPNESMDYYNRDIGYINIVAEIFGEHLGTKKIRQMNDEIQLYFDPEPLNSEINTISNSLKYSVTKNNITQKLLNEIKDTYAKLPIEIYSLAINDGKYIGSDTWRFFKNKVEDYCVEDGYRNILIILTDGYIYHKNTRIREGNLTTYITPQTIRADKLNNSNWKTRMNDKDFGFIPAISDLSNLEILVVGINPSQSNPYEEDVIKYYWGKWFDSMYVKRYEIKSADLPSNMERVIRNFILEN